MARNNYYLSFTQTQRQQKQVPTGEQVVPLKDPQMGLRTNVMNGKKINSYIAC
jgi:hypothetical protein